MSGIRTKPAAPSPAEIAEVKRGFSLYREVHFFERKDVEELDRFAIQRRLPPKGKLVRIQRQVGL